MNGDSTWSPLGRPARQSVTFRLLVPSPRAVGDPVRIAYGHRHRGVGGGGAHDAPAGARRGDGVGQDDDGLTADAAPGPRTGDLVGCPVAQPLPRAQPPGR